MRSCSIHDTPPFVSHVPGIVYGMMYVVKRTTIYLPDDLKRRLQRAAEAQSKTEAEIIREALRRALEDVEPPRPSVPLFSDWGDPTIADRVDEVLSETGYGDDR